MQIDDQSIKNILVVRNDRFGEFLLNIPAFRALKETFCNARIIIIVNPYVGELARAIPFIDEVIVWPQVKHSIQEKLRLIIFLKRKNINIAIMMNPCKEFNIITYLSGIPVRAGYNRKWGFLLTHKMEDKKYLGQKHEIEYNLELVNVVGAKTRDKALSLKIGDNTFKWPSNKNIKNGDSLIALHPLTSDPSKQWPIEHFINLAKRLAAGLNKKVIIIGSKPASEATQEDFNDSDGDIINMIGKTTLMQLAALLEKCTLLISGDSGPVHLASCVGVPVLALFRNDIPGKGPKRWGPTCHGSAVIEKPNLLDITVEEVVGKAKEMLDK